MEYSELLEISGAREHNLKNLDVVIPRDKLVVITGLSGSGKSSLAFDTIYAEGQRRYIETFSSYARQFLGGLERPDVDNITGLSPVISIEQKTVGKNPRSTVGTITEIYDFLRLLYARAADAFSSVTGEKMVKYSDEQIASLILSRFQGKRILILSPIIRSRKGHYRELFEQLRNRGFIRARIDGNLTDLKPRMQLDRYKVHDIELLIDTIDISTDIEKRLRNSLSHALKHGQGMVQIMEDAEDATPSFYSRSLMCPTSGVSYSEPEPNTFSFNSPYGVCPACHGLGEVSEIDASRIIPDPTLSIRKGGIAPLKDTKSAWILKQIEAIGHVYHFTLNTPINEIPEEALTVILEGSDEVFQIKDDVIGLQKARETKFDGIINFILKEYEENHSPAFARWAQGFMNKIVCRSCNGARLKPEALQFKLDEKNIAELSSMDLISLRNWVKELPQKVNDRQLQIAGEIIKEINARIGFLCDVGLSYLSLNRGARTLSGGEAQRIRLASQIGSQLVGVMYILDEPSIGLHQRDNDRLIGALKNLRDIGNSVLVVEHDKEIMMAADYVIDLGPGAGIHGGQITGQGTYEDLIRGNSLTSKYLSGELQIRIPAQRRKGNGQILRLSGATGHNLKDVTIEIFLGTLTCITGVSGSGKSTLINQTLYPILSNHFYRSAKQVMPYTKIDGLKYLDKVIEIDQSPIGRTPRSNPATYTGVFTDIRTLFAELPEAKIRGYKPGRFSFNVKGGRCETCQGGGMKAIEMNFLPDVHVLCETCNGKRYNRETLEVRYKGKSISDVLDMPIEEAVPFFEHIPSIVAKIKSLQEVGLGYIKLGQASTTLSGGEAQRVKLATELSKKDTGKTIYILDEPTTGLHFEDIRLLLLVLNRLTDQGNTVVVIEHNLDIIKIADYIIDLGPDGGNGGGIIVAQGTPEEIAGSGKGYTSTYLKKELQEGRRKK